MSTRMSTDMNVTKPTSRVSRPPGGATTFSFSQEEPIKNVPVTPAKKAAPGHSAPVAVVEQEVAPAPAPAPEKKVVKGKVGIVVAGSVGADIITGAISKALQVAGVSGSVVVTVPEVAVLPYAAQSLSKTTDVVIASCIVTSDPSGVVGQSLTSSIMQIGCGGKVPMVAAVISQDSLLEVKAILPHLAEEWAKSAVSILELKSGVEPIAAPVHEIKEKPVHTPVVNDTDTLMELFRESLKSRGARGIAGLSRKFKIIDDNNSGTVDLSEFTKCIGEHAFAWTPAQIKLVFDKFDDDKSGSITFDEFLVGVRGQLNERRRNLVLQAFQILDADKSGVVELNDIMAKYDASKHPDVKTGKRTKEDVLSEFLDTFDTEEKDGKVTPGEFCKYYSNVSSSIDDDDYFELMIRNAWHISGGEGWCANSSNRRVLCVHKDGRQTVEEIKNDLGIGPKDTDKMMANLVEQGILDVVSIDTSGSTSSTTSPPAEAAASTGVAAAPSSPAGHKARGHGGEIEPRPKTAASAGNPRRQPGGASTFTLG